MACGQLRIEQDQDDAQHTEVDEALAAWGLVAAEPMELEETFALWPENLPTFNFWRVIQTQWRIGGTGRPSGLDYGGVHTCMDLHGIRKKNQPEVFAGLQAMERATLIAWDKQAQKR